jgi:hypothetical protein
MLMSGDFYGSDGLEPATSGVTGRERAKVAEDEQGQKKPDCA